MDGLVTRRQLKFLDHGLENVELVLPRRSGVVADCRLIGWVLDRVR